MRACRLQTDYVDLYQFHHIDLNTPWDEIWQAIEVAVQAGKILYVGSSNFGGWHIADAQAAAARRNPDRSCQRAIALQPDRPRHRARGRPAAELRARDHPLVTTAGGPARWCDQEGEHRRPAT